MYCIIELLNNPEKKNDFILFSVCIIPYKYTVALFRSETVLVGVTILKICYWSSSNELLITVTINAAKLAKCYYLLNMLPLCLNNNFRIYNFNISINLQ